MIGRETVASRPEPNALMHTKPPGKQPAPLCRFWLALVVTLAGWPAWALPPDKAVDQYILEHFDGSDGLPQNSVNGVIQDETGYLWLATFDGLVRFDGARFVRMPDTDLPGRRLRIVGRDDAGFWIGGEHGGLSHHDGQRPRRLDLDDLGIDGSVSHVVRRATNLWIATHDGLYRLHDGELAERFGVESGLPGSGVWNLAFGADDTLFAGTPRGLFMRPAGAEAFEPVAHEALRGKIIYDLVVDTDADALWIGSERGLFRRSGGEIREVAVSTLPRADWSVRSLSLDRHGNLWAGVWGHGLARVNADGVELLTRADGLTNQRFTSIHEDREGSLWFGTDGGGLGRLRDGTVTAHGGSEWGLASSAVTTITEDADGSLWLGLNCEGVARFDDGLEALYSHESGLRNNCIFTLLVDDRERLWAGSFGSGVYRMQGESFVPVPVPEGHGRLLALYQRSDGEILAGSDNGLLRYQPDTDRFVALEALAGRNVRFITEDRRGELWLATRNGVLRGDPASGFEPLDFPELTDVRAIHLRDDGSVWLGTYGSGLFRLRDGRLFQFTPRHGLDDRIVSRIIEDDLGHLWLTGNRGIHGIAIDRAEAVATGRRERLDVLSLGPADGMRTAETNGGSQPAGTMTDEGRIWVPTIDGIAGFDPARTQRNELPPPVVIERVVVDGHERPVTDTVELPADARSLEIHYTGLSLLVPDRVAFRYRLGSDAPWQEAGNRRIAYFSSLPPGSHEFTVIAANNDGVWNSTGASLRLEAAAAFHETPLFPLVLAAGSVLVVSSLFGLWMRHARRRQRQLRKLVRERTDELEVANGRLEVLARIDELTGIANRRHLEETLVREWGRARRRGEWLALAMIDIDDFKAFNDHYGHLAGDECLRRISEALSGRMHRSNDFLGRFGGEEFLAILPETTPAGALHMAESMQQAVRELAIPHRYGPESGCVTISIGLAATEPADVDMDAHDLLRVADETLYEAKRGGRDRIRQATVPPPRG